MCLYAEVQNDLDIEDVIAAYQPDVFKGYFLCLKYTDLSDKDMVYYKSNGDAWQLLPSKYMYLENDQKIKSWYNCLYNNNMKLLKDPKGNKWIISATESTNRSIDYNSSSLPTKISFSWQEVMDADKVVILNFDTIKQEG